MSLEYIKQQHEARNRAWEEAKTLLDSAAAEKRELQLKKTQNTKLSQQT